MAIVGIVIFTGRNGYGPIAPIVGANIPPGGFISSIINITTPAQNASGFFGTFTPQTVGAPTLFQILNIDESAQTYIAAISTV